MPPRINNLIVPLAKTQNDYVWKNCIPLSIPGWVPQYFYFSLLSVCTILNYMKHLGFWDILLAISEVNEALWEGGQGGEGLILGWVGGSPQARLVAENPENNKTNNKWHSNMREKNDVNLNDFSFFYFILFMVTLRNHWNGVMI